LTNAEVHAAIIDILAAAGVQRVISVDDTYAEKYPVEEALAASEQLDRPALDSVFHDYPGIVASTDLDIWKQQVRKLWETLELLVKRRLMRQLRDDRAVPGADQSAKLRQGLDDSTANLLPELFAKYELFSLSLKDWRTRKAELLTDDMPVTLMMVDEDFSGEGESNVAGLHLVKELLATSKPEKLLCALLSHNYEREGIHERWKELSRQQELDQSRFVLIPKSVFDKDLITFARLVKLAILNKPVNELRKTATTIILSSVTEAEKRLDAIDIYDFEQIVFLSSYLEGVWEPDTLFRIFGLFHREETRKAAKADAGLRKLADTIRAISQIQTKSSSSPNYNTIALQRLELYEEREYLNSHFTPIDLGDIFQKTQDSTKQYILLGQTCDLMVRKEGARHHAIVEAMLAEIVNDSEERGEGFGELPFFDSVSGKSSYVAFKKAIAVDLMVLDLCALNPNGECTFTVGSSCPDTAIPTWKLHHKKISTRVEKLLAAVERLSKSGVKLEEATTMVARSSNQKLFKPKIDLQTKTLSYDVKRVGRFTQPRAASLLSRYANFLARHAFDHEFGKSEEGVHAQITPPAGGDGPAAPSQPSDASAEIIASEALGPTSMEAAPSETDAIVPAPRKKTPSSDAIS
jgi:hypothetical protein